MPLGRGVATVLVTHSRCRAIDKWFAKKLYQNFHSFSLSPRWNVFLLFIAVFLRIGTIIGSTWYERGVFTRKFCFLTFIYLIGL
jgi:cell division protein FtsX